tara:strand:- start:205 stop:879 length:675 start_codon:yes stop_codon:yes gene_type:complete
MISTGFPTEKEISRLTAEMLIDIKAVHFSTEEPFILASGLPSPIYIDCRKLISYPRIRSALIDFLVCTIVRETGFEKFDNIAGGETAGIPFSTLIAERLSLPLTYVRKKAKGYGRNARIEGVMRENEKVLLVEDMTTDGSSKISFVDAIRNTGANCTDIAVIFYYDIFPETLKKLNEHGTKLYYLCTWWDVLAITKERKAFDVNTIKNVESFLHSPRRWQEKNK